MQCLGSVGQQDAGALRCTYTPREGYPLAAAPPRCSFFVLLHVGFKLRQQLFLKSNWGLFCKWAFGARALGTLELVFRV